MYLHCVYWMLFYIEIGHFLGIPDSTTFEANVSLYAEYDI